MVYYKDQEIYNCNECFNTDCGYWADYNHFEEEREETEQERILDPYWEEFFEATCERYRKND
jgi:hypothetical protein